MTRKEFFEKVGIGAATALLVPACISGLAVTSCSRDDSSSTTTAPTVDFTIDVSTGALSANGGYIVQNGVIVARTTSGSFIAVSAACTHQGTTINYVSSSNNFLCPNHGATFSGSGAVTKGPASTNLKQYNTTLTGSSLRIYG